jgi:hypothetical protein
MTHGLRASRARLGSACVLVGLVSALTVWSVPAALAGTPSPPGANTRHMAPQAAGPSAPGVITPRFKCEKPGHSHSIHVTADLSGLHATASYNRKHPTQLVLDVKATPRFTLDVNFSGDVKCTASALASFPLGDTGLRLKIGPELVFKASGEVGAFFTWKPTIDVGFTLNSKGFSKLTHSFASGGGVVFTGRGTASLQLKLHAVVETLGGFVGVTGDVGPVITATVTGTTATHTACWKGSIAADAQFGAFVHFIGLKVHKESPVFQLGKADTLAGCLSRTIVFYGKPGTGAPPGKLGPYTMRRFAADPTAVGTVEKRISGPTGPVVFSTPLTHLLIGNGWATWSNGYTGDVYETATPQPDGTFVITVTLPPGTGAFYAYAEPNLFADFSMNATAQNGVTSGDVTVHGQAGARYFGFYATCGHTLTKVTYTDGAGDTAMAIGEFGIARARAC